MVSPLPDEISYILDGYYIVERDGIVAVRLPATWDQLNPPSEPEVDIVALANQLAAVAEAVDYLLLNDLMGDL